MGKPQDNPWALAMLLNFGHVEMRNGLAYIRALTPKEKRKTKKELLAVIESGNAGNYGRDFEHAIAISDKRKPPPALLRHKMIIGFITNLKANGAKTIEAKRIACNRYNFEFDTIEEIWKKRKTIMK